MGGLLGCWRRNGYRGLLPLGTRIKHNQLYRLVARPATMHLIHHFRKNIPRFENTMLGLVSIFHLKSAGHNVSGIWHGMRVPRQRCVCRYDKFQHSDFRLSGWVSCILNSVPRFFSFKQNSG